MYKFLQLLMVSLFCFSAPCYAEPPGAMKEMLAIFLLIVIICGVVLGLFVKAILSYTKIEATNWYVFLFSILLAGAIMYALVKG